MTRVDLAFAFAQARLQARYGARPSAAAWSHIEATGSLASLLQLVRGTVLGRWTGRLGDRPGVHLVELRLREEWQREVAEVAAWQPRPWRFAIDWLRWVPYLPGLEKLARGGHPQSWMRADPVLGPIVASEPRDRRDAFQSSQLAPLAVAFGHTVDTTHAWVEHWRSLWPGPQAGRAPLEALLTAAGRHGERLAELPADARSRDATASFLRRLQLAFRRHPLSPTASAAYLGVLFIDLARLRGQLALRALREQTVASP